MPDYDFVCYECEVYTTVTCSMNDDETRSDVKCPKCSKKMERIFNIPNTIVKSPLGSDARLSPNQTIVNCDGQPVRLNFIDHGDRSGLSDSSLAKKYPGARIDEKTGKPVVDVVSNIPDPLGKIEASRRKGNIQKKERKVGQGYRTKK